jgi:deazaflavin-dependent oxidoreductase (nitroreductase family)
MQGVRPVDPTASPGRAGRVLHRMAMTEAGRWYGMNVASRIDPWLLRVSRGRFATTMVFPLVMLTTRGRRSGQPRTVPLVYFTHGEEVIVTASSFGRARYPAWYLNAKANPDVELMARGRRLRCVARETEGEERDRLFELVKRLYAGYGRYEQIASERTIPVLALRSAG